jgi:hypothetical protein
MLEEFVTPLWKAVSQALPPAVRKRYQREMKSAEDLDLALDRVIELLFRRPAH